MGEYCISNQFCSELLGASQSQPSARAAVGTVHLYMPHGAFVWVATLVFDWLAHGLSHSCSKTSCRLVLLHASFSFSKTASCSLVIMNITRMTTIKYCSVTRRVVLSASIKGIKYKLSTIRWSKKKHVHYCRAHEGAIQLTYLLLSTATPTVLLGVAMLATKFHWRAWGSHLWEIVKQQMFGDNKLNISKCNEV